MPSLQFAAVPVGRGWPKSNVNISFFTLRNIFIWLWARVGSRTGTVTVTVTVIVTVTVASGWARPGELRNLCWQPPLGGRGDSTLQMAVESHSLSEKFHFCKQAGRKTKT